MGYDLCPFCGQPPGKKHKPWCGERGTVMAAKRQWSTSQDWVIRNAAADGSSRADAAAELGLPEIAVKRRAKELGVRFTHGCKLNLDLRARVLELIEAGVNTAPLIGRAMRRSRQMICQWVNEFISSGLLARIGDGKLTRIVLAAD